MDPCCCLVWMFGIRAALRRILLPALSPADTEPEGDPIALRPAPVTQVTSGDLAVTTTKSPDQTRFT